MLKITKPLILASSSVSRKMLLHRLNLAFDTISPDINESPKSNEKPADLAERLALEKAQAVARQASSHYIIASDQVALCNNRILSKPMKEHKAVEQLRFQSGRQTTFYTSLCLLNSSSGQFQLGHECFTVTFRKLSDEYIKNYITYDQPLHCAGSFKAESLGITLFEKMQGNDPTALIGLPLILLTSFIKSL